MRGFPSRQTECFLWACSGAHGRERLEATRADPLIGAILDRITQVLQSVAAHSSRNETLQWLMTSVMWHVAGPWIRLAFVAHLLQPQLMSQHVTGIPKVLGMTLHFDAPANEWYISTTIGIHAQAAGRKCFLVFRSHTLIITRDQRLIKMWFPCSILCPSVLHVKIHGVHSWSSWYTGYHIIHVTHESPVQSPD
jgi:hypothetical protein